MTMRRFVQAAGITAVALFLMVASASASTVTFNTSSALTIFVGGTDVLNSTGGAAATLTFNPNPVSVRCAVQRQFWRLPSLMPNLWDTSIGLGYVVRRFHL